MQDPMQDQQGGHFGAPQSPGQQGFGPGQQGFGPGEQAFGSAPMVEEEEGWGKIGIVMVTLALIFAGGVAYFIATSGDDDLAGTSEPTMAEPAVAIANATDASPSGDSEEVSDATPADLSVGGGDAGPEAIAIDAGSDANAEPLRANGEIDRPAGLVSLSIESEPSGADVIRKADGVRLGMTPYLYETEAMPGTINFVLQLDGYKSMSMSLPSDRDSVRQVMLLPGKGGAPIPAPEPPTKAEPTKTKLVPTVTPIESKSRKTSAPAKTPRKTRDPAPTRPSKKPKAGRVDYNPDSIPLD